MAAPFQICWDRVERAEVHRQAMEVENSIFVPSLVLAPAFFSPDGRDALSTQIRIGILRLRCGDSGVQANPPPDEKRWTFPLAETPEKFEEATRGMKELPNSLRGLLEAVQPYKRATGNADVVGKWDFGKALLAMNMWAIIDRHRRNSAGASRFPLSRRLWNECRMLRL
jgi:hypothetical protein